MPIFDLASEADIKNQTDTAASLPYDQQRDSAPGFFEGVQPAYEKGLQAAKYNVLNLMAQGANKSGLIDDKVMNVFDGVFATAKTSLQPDPAVTGFLGKLVQPVTTTLATALPAATVGGPLAAAAFAGTSEGVAQTTELEAEGVDKSTARKVGLVTGITTGAGLVAPAAIGTTLPVKVASGAAMNTAIGAGQRGLTGKLLRDNGYSDMADQYKVLDGTAILTDSILGGAFGVLHGPPEHLPSTRDTGLAANNIHQLEIESAPGIPTDIATRNSHIGAMDAATRQLYNNEPVEISKHIQEANFLPAERNPEIRTGMDESLQESGIDELQRTLDTRGQGIQYHGTSNPISDIKEYYYSPLNYYGSGFYTTDALDIAEGYSKKGGGSEPTIYRYNPSGESQGKLFNMEKSLTREEVEKLGLPSEFVATYDDLLSNGIESPNMRQIYDEIREFESSQGNNADYIQEIYDSARVSLENGGYQGLRHKGGIRTGNKEHNVEIYWPKEGNTGELNPMGKQTSAPKLTTLYHGTRVPFDTLRPTESGITFFAEDESTASRYAIGRGGNREAKTRDNSYYVDHNGKVYEAVGEEWKPIGKMPQDDVIVNRDKLLPVEDNTPLTDEVVNKELQAEGTLIPKEARIIKQEFKDVKLLDTVLSKDTQEARNKALEDVSVVAGLEPDNRYSQQLINSAKKAIKDNHPGDFNREFWGMTKRVPTELRGIVEQLREKGYEGIRFQDDQHPSVGIWKNQDILTKPRILPEKTPPTFLEWLSKQGGVQDTGGDMSYMNAQDWHKGKPFAGKLIKETGMKLDDATLKAWEEGYFPEFSERPDINAFYEKVDRELRGQKQFPDRFMEQVVEDPEYVAHLMETMSDKEGYRLASEIADYHESRYNAYEQAEKEWLATRGEEWTPEEPTTLQDLENERREQEEASATPEESAKDYEQPGSTSDTEKGGKGSVPERGGIAENPGQDVNAANIIAEKPYLTVVDEEGNVVSAQEALTKADEQIVKAEKEKSLFEIAVNCFIRNG